MLRTLVSAELTKLGKSRVKFSNNSRDELNGKSEFNGKNKFDDYKVDSDKVGDNKVTEEKNYQKTRKISKSKKTIRFFGLFYFWSKTSIYQIEASVC